MENYLINISALTLGLLAFIWSRKSLLNVFIKIYFYVLTLSLVLQSLINYGFIIKM
jgi:hypothetical protein